MPSRLTSSTTSNPFLPENSEKPVDAVESILYAIRTTLREDLGPFLQPVTGNKEIVDIMPDDRPHPAAGKIFISLYAGNEDFTQSAGFERKPTFTAAVTLRTSSIPFDRVGTEAITKDETSQARHDVLDPSTSPQDSRLFTARYLTRLVGQLIHGRSIILQRAQALQTTPYEAILSGALYIKPPLPTKPEIVGPDHFHGHDYDAPQNNITGLLCRINFSGLNIYQIPNYGFDPSAPFQN